MMLLRRVLQMLKKAKNRHKQNFEEEASHVLLENESTEKKV